MIRETSFQQQKRRIAVVKVQRPQRARMGSIGIASQPARQSVVSWAPTTASTPDSSDNWMSTVLARQNYARSTTPGTFSYTPASNTPATNVAPWNSWVQPNCDPSNLTPANPGVDPGPASGAPSSFWKMLGILGGAAASVYLLHSLSGKR